MRRPTSLLSALLLMATPSVFAQNAAPRATPQTQDSTPASPAAPSATRPGTGRTAARGVAARGGARRGGSPSRSQANPAPAQRSSAPTGNASVGVIGDSNSDGLLDRNGSAALPGVAMMHNAMGIAAGTPIHVRLQQTIDSGHAHNGDTVRGTLDAPLGKLAAGVPVTLTVVAAAAAGQLSSSGVLSLQVISVNGEQVLSQVITAEGKEGAKLLPSDAPARGTEAIFSSEQPITLPTA